MNTIKPIHRSMAFAAALALSLLAPSAHAQSRSAPSGAIQVAVVNGAIQVSARSLTTGAGQATLTWQIATDGYRFAANSIDFGNAQGYFSCGTLNGGMTMRCTKSADAPGGNLPYRIQLSDGQYLLQMPQPNLWIQNE